MSPLKVTPWKKDENLPVVTSPIIVQLGAIHSELRSRGNFELEMGTHLWEGTTKKVMCLFYRNIKIRK